LAELKEVMGCGEEDLGGLQEIMLNADQDKDGQISFPEFKNLMRKMYKQ
jgi:Ca2+-binding EF-hand superfamily protein